MKFGSLSQFFSTFAWKRVTDVEVDPKKSNGHEFNSSTLLRKILGTTTPRKFNSGTGIRCRFLYFRDDEDEPSEDLGWLSWYNSREKKSATRSPEWRLYYTENAVFGRNPKAKTGDFVVIAFSAGNEAATVLVAECGSTYESQLRWLFGITEEAAQKFETAEVKATQFVDMTRARILEAAGVVVPASDDALLERMLNLFGSAFPSSAIFGAFVRGELPDVRAEDGADSAIIAWMEREEFAFRVLEKHIVGERLKKGFKDVDDFVDCSLSVHNRRKSRAGNAFENHLGEVFRAHGLAYERSVTVEDKAKPDFLFPGSAQYFDTAFPAAWLTLLGAKTSCKDRWRQVLAESSRVTEKHIITLEPAISANQLAQMRKHNLQLVVPAPLHATYPNDERANLWDMATFIAAVGDKQRRAGIGLDFTDRTRKAKRRDNPAK
jgi:hypothetical protein